MALKVNLVFNLNSFSQSHVQTYKISRMIGTFSILTWFIKLLIGGFWLLMARNDVEIASYCEIQETEVSEMTLGRE